MTSALRSERGIQPTILRSSTHSPSKSRPSRVRRGGVGLLPGPVQAIEANGRLGGGGGQQLLAQGLQVAQLTLVLGLGLLSEPDVDVGQSSDLALYLANRLSGRASRPAWIRTLWGDGVQALKEVIGPRQHQRAIVCQGRRVRDRRLALATWQ